MLSSLKEEKKGWQAHTQLLETQHKIEINGLELEVRAKDLEIKNLQIKNLEFEAEVKDREILRLQALVSVRES